MNVHWITPSTRHATGSHDTKFDPPLRFEPTLPTSSTTGSVESKVAGFDTSALGGQIHNRAVPRRHPLPHKAFDTTPISTS
jgi:hypothetical protein